MNDFKKYRRKEKTIVTAVRLDLETDGFTYRKWGGVQTCKPGDWVVNNAGEAYTIDAASFSKTYHETAPGRYEKVSAVWARAADADGAIATKEGSTQYSAGDYLVYNDAHERDGYAMSAEKFQTLYEPAD